MRPIDTQTAARLATAARIGDKDALDTLFQLILPDLRRIAARTLQRSKLNPTRNDSGRIPFIDIDDLVHDTYIILPQVLQEWDPARSRLAQFLAITVPHRLAQLYQHHSTRAVIHRMPTSPDGDNDELVASLALQGSAPDHADDTANRLDCIEILKQARLTRNQLLTVYLHYWQGVPIAEIAEILHIPPTRTYRYHQQALRRLRAHTRAKPRQTTPYHWPADENAKHRLLSHFLRLFWSPEATLPSPPRTQAAGFTQGQHHWIRRTLATAGITIPSGPSAPPRFAL